MSLFDFFFPEQAQASHLRRLAQNTSRKSAMENSARRRTLQLETRVEELEASLGFTTLVLGALVQALDQKGVVTRDDLRTVMHEVDSIDGVTDGKIDIDFLRGRMS